MGIKYFRSAGSAVQCSVAVAVIGLRSLLELSVACKHFHGGGGGGWFVGIWKIILGVPPWKHERLGNTVLKFCSFAGRPDKKHNVRAKHVFATFVATVRNVVLTCMLRVHNVFEQNLNLVQLNLLSNDTFC
jgi:hypothetical protein